MSRRLAGRPAAPPRTSPSSGAVGVLRVLVWAGTALALGAGAHARSAGLPGPGALLLPAPLLVATAVWFGRRERGIGALFGSLTLAQVALHLWFHLAGCRGGAHLAAVHHPVRGATALGPVWSQPGPAAGLVPSPGMLAAHAAAVVLAACLLGWGERSLWAMARRWLPALPARTAAPPLTHRIAALPPRPLTPGSLRVLLPARGPPAPSCG